ncbi:uncharacterized protein [Onthophagus taurus]|uniref:uncharacterized protein n=1 Tax=Onthophagus taurus TaxID=166361 RepID=UPI0039BE9753
MECNNCENCDLNQTSCDEVIEKVSTENEATPSPPTLDVLHEDVKNYIISHLEQQGYKDITINVEIGSSLGDNFMGFIGKLTITALNQSNEPKTFNWIVKAAPNLETYRAMMDISISYKRESFLYSEVFKTFQDFQKEKDILEPFNNHAKHILSYLEHLKESLVLEDMKQLGYVMRPRQEPLDWNHVKLVMKAYAKFHAVSYALKDQKPDVFKKLSDNCKDTFRDTMMKESVIQAQAPMIKMGLKALDPKVDGKLIKIFEKFIVDYPNILLTLLDDTNNQSVIGHGDSWVNNMLWKYDNELNNIPKKVCLLDWQLARFGSPACDLSYFIFTCTSKQLRDKHYDDMIKLYYYTLCAHVNELGTDPQKYLTFQQLEGEMKKYSVVGLLLTVMVLCIITKDSSEIPEWRSDDINMEEAQEQWTQSGKNSHIYNERVRGVLVDFYEKGYLKIVEEM